MINLKKVVLIMSYKFRLTCIGDESAEEIENQLKIYNKSGWNYIEKRIVREL